MSVATTTWSQSCDAPEFVADVDGVPVCDAETDDVSEPEAVKDGVGDAVSGGDSVRDGVLLHRVAKRVASRASMDQQISG